MQVLEGDEDRVYTFYLFLVARPSGEVERGDAWVVHNLARIQVTVQGINDLITIRRAGARDLDWPTIRSWDGTITVTRSGGVQAARVTNIRDKVGVDTSLEHGCGGCSRDEDSSDSDESGSELHDDVFSCMKRGFRVDVCV